MATRQNQQSPSGEEQLEQGNVSQQTQESSSPGSTEGNSGQTEAQRQQAGGENTGEQQNSSQGGENQQGQSGGDRTIALRQERERRRQLTEENQRLRQQLAGMQATGGADGDLDLSEFEITQDEINNGDTDKLNQKIRGMLSKATQSVSQRLSQNMSGTQEINRVLDGYEIFNDSEDPELSADALSAASREIESLQRNERTPVKIRDAVDKVAQRYSKYRVQRHQERTGNTGGQENHPVTTSGSGPGEAAHYQTQGEPPKTDEEALSRSQDVARRKAEEKGIRWD